MEQRVITITSQTVAIKARRLLKDSGIRARIIKLNPKDTPRGCTYGVEVDLTVLYDAIAVLRKGGVPYSDTINLSHSRGQRL